MPESSVEAVQARVMLELDGAVAVRPPGTLGGVVSFAGGVVPPITG